MLTGIEFRVVWSDQDVCKFRVACSNGFFCGTANIYLNHDEAAKMAETLNGFPSHTLDSRDVELGAFDPSHAGGGIRMRFYCRDSAGHPAVEVKLRGEACAALGEVESVALCIPTEAAAIDAFLAQLREMDTGEIGAASCLLMASK